MDKLDLGTYVVGGQACSRLRSCFRSLWLHAEVVPLAPIPTSAQCFLLDTAGAMSRHISTSRAKTVVGVYNPTTSPELLANNPETVINLQDKTPSIQYTYAQGTIEIVSKGAFAFLLFLVASI